MQKELFFNIYIFGLYAATDELVACFKSIHYCRFKNTNIFKLSNVLGKWLCNNKG